MSHLSLSLPLNSSVNPLAAPTNDVSATTAPLFAISIFSRVKPDSCLYFALTLELNDAGFLEFSYVVLVVRVIPYGPGDLTFNVYLQSKSSLRISAELLSKSCSSK